jgi:hypothetical protein
MAIPLVVEAILVKPAPRMTLQTLHQYHLKSFQSLELQFSWSPWENGKRQR